jgi:hypothetical protein
MCFHGTELATQHRMVPALRHQWEVLLTCAHCPLRYCLHSVRFEFLRLVYEVCLVSEDCWLMLPAEIILSFRATHEGRGGGGGLLPSLSEGSNGHPVGGSKIGLKSFAVGNSCGGRLSAKPLSSHSTLSSSGGTVGNPLDSFFPFDPCLLCALHRVVTVDQSH